MFSNGSCLDSGLQRPDENPIRITRAGAHFFRSRPDFLLVEFHVQLRTGDLLVAYSDGVTEPESDYGEFGEDRLVQIIRENRHLPLTRITEIVTAAVDDWIGDKEQPDDVTLVLARAR